MFCMDKRICLLLIAVVFLSACTSPSSPVVTLSTSPADPVAGQETELSFSLIDNGKPLELQIHHERKLHTVIISENFDVFGHIHPEDFSLENAVKFTFPYAGRYAVAIDYMANDVAGSKQFFVDVSGSPSLTRKLTDVREEKCFASYPEEATDRYTKPFVLSESEVPCLDGYRATFSYDQETATVSYRFEKDGSPVVFDPYLGEVMHLAVADEDLDMILHTHAITDEEGFYQSVPLALSPGKYYVFSQSKVDGEFVVTRFEFIVSQETTTDSVEDHTGH